MNKMIDFSELDDLYKHLETNAGDYKYKHQIANLFQKLRDLKHEAGQTDDAEKAQWEIDCFSFTIRDGELKCHFSGTDGKGQPYEYPSISKLSDNQFDYIEKRLTATSNPILKARYAHILWESPRKHDKYLKIAVDSYLELIKFYEEKDRKDTEGHFGLDVLNSVKNASSLAFRIGYRIDEIRSELSRLVREFNFQSSSAFVMRPNLIRHMLEGKTRFPKDCFEGFSEIVLNLGKKFYDAGRFHNAIRLFEAGERVDKKLNLNTIDWNRSIAECYEGLMNQRDESDLAATTFCQDSIKYYKKIKDKNKIKELEKRYEELRGKQQYQVIKQDLDLSAHAKQCREIAEKLSEETPEKIISTLIADKSLLPAYKAMEKRAKEIAETAVFSNIAPVTVSDHYGHTAEHFTSDDEKKYYHILEQYTWELQLTNQILINEIFFSAIKKGKLNIHTLMDFFENHSWYGKNISKKVPQNQTVTYNWLNMIAPGLNDYFNQTHAHFQMSEYRPNFVLAMDSLSLKIEGLVRDICAFSGLTTFYQTNDKQGRNIVREKDINWLLREEPIKKLFDEDDLLFFKFVLVEKGGLNLRHKIAHCLIDYSEYNMTYMHLIILALMKLGRYDFVKKETVEERVADSE